jgi:MoaA/NifB/PqqE/SkfB family radical SAM enzyme
MKSKTFCALPWHSIATNASGVYRICCNSTPGKNVIKDSTGLPMKIFQNSPTDIWNSDTYKQIRQQMLAGEQPEMCKRCFKEEDSGVDSARINFNKKWYKSDKNYQIEDKGNDIHYIDLRLGNLCNLRCRMCNPYSSNQWVDEWNSVVKTATLEPNFTLSDIEQKRLTNLKWPSNEITWQSLMQIASSIEEIYLTGGEPTLALEQYKLFDMLINMNRSNSIRLKYNTNLTNIPPKMIDYWSSFQSVKINASVDATEELNRYIRYPTSWKSVENNLNKLIKLNNIQIEIHCTVQLYNILNLNSLFEWISKYSNIPIYLNILNHPTCLNIQVLPADLKKLAEERLQPYILLPKVQSIIKYMNKRHNSLMNMIKRINSNNSGRHSIPSLKLNSNTIS